MPEVSPSTPHDIHLGGEPRICLLGFSCRALAEACCAVNLPVFSIDCFADQDLCEHTSQWQQLANWDPNLLFCSTSESRSPVAQNPASIAKALENLKSKGPLLLAGGTENWAPWFDQLRNFAPILGPDSKQLQKSRDPLFWQHLANQVEGLSFPATKLSSDISQTGQMRKREHVKWLSKSLASSGGLGVHASETDESGESPIDHYLQEEVQGRVLGACLMLPSAPQECELVGVTESWREQDWPGPTRFIYRGSFGPIQLREAQNQILLDLAEQVQRMTGLRGWLGVDFIEDAEGQLWLLELNPRWTAGMEVLARTGRNPVPSHLACFTPDLISQASLAQINACNSDSVWQPRSIAAKAVVYVEREIRLGVREVATLHGLPRRNFADIPRPPENQPELVIEPGHPFLTLRDDCQNHAGSREELLDRLRELHRQLREQIPGC